MLSEKNIQGCSAHGLAKQPPEISITFMKDLPNAHLGIFPFNNLGVLLHENLSLESQVLFERVVTKRRGGYCFEQDIKSTLQSYRFLR